VYGQHPITRTVRRWGVRLDSPCSIDIGVVITGRVIKRKSYALAIQHLPDAWMHRGCKRERPPFFSTEGLSARVSLQQDRRAPFEQRQVFWCMERTVWVEIDRERRLLTWTFHHVSSLTTDGVPGRTQQRVHLTIPADHPLDQLYFFVRLTRGANASIVDTPPPHPPPPLPTAPAAPFS
jgi:hypothetical protein